MEIPSIKSGINDCTLMSKEEDNPKRSKASEVFKKYKYSKGNDEIKSTSHVQPVNTYNNRRKNFNKRGLKVH